MTENRFLLPFRRMKDLILSLLDRNSSTENFPVIFTSAGRFISADFPLLRWIIAAPCLYSGDGDPQSVRFWESNAQGSVWKSSEPTEQESSSTFRRVIDLIDQRSPLSVCVSLKNLQTLIDSMSGDLVKIEFVSIQVSSFKSQAFLRISDHQQLIALINANQVDFTFVPLSERTPEDGHICWVACLNRDGTVFGTRGKWNELHYDFWVETGEGSVLLSEMTNSPKTTTFWASSCLSSQVFAQFMSLLYPRKIPLED